jgi:hypothetical protein
MDNDALSRLGREFQPGHGSPERCPDLAQVSKATPARYDWAPIPVYRTGEASPPFANHRKRAKRLDLPERGTVGSGGCGIPRVGEADGAQ